MNASTKKPVSSPLLSALSGLWNVCAGPSNEASPLTVRLEKIARGNAGKSAVEWALGKTIVSNFFPSGLQLDVDDPQQVAGLLQANRTIRQRLEQDPLLPTLEATPIRYTLFEGEQKRLILHSHEVIGQILTHTTPASPPEWQARYREYMARLADTDVLWVLLPTPPAQAAAAERERFEDDLKITTGYLRKALELRAAGRPAAVALVLTKLDTLFATAQQAREELSDDVLRQSLAPLVTLAAMSAKVETAAIIPTSAFGFGTAVRKPEPPAPPADAAPAAAPRPEPQEAQWILRPDAHVLPFNLLTLAVWSLLHGLAGKEVEPDSEPAAALTRVLRMLHDDLADAGWLVPIKTRR